MKDFLSFRANTYNVDETTSEKKKTFVIVKLLFFIVPFQVSEVTKV